MIRVTHSHTLVGDVMMSKTSSSDNETRRHIMPWRGYDDDNRDFDELKEQTKHEINDENPKKSQLK